MNQLSHRRLVFSLAVSTGKCLLSSAFLLLSRYEAMAGEHCSLALKQERMNVSKLAIYHKPPNNHTLFSLRSSTRIIPSPGSTSTHDAWSLSISTRLRISHSCAPVGR
ncbi:hypothetical protein CC80DRAFT_259118 [Byssothecium circinans]|uniref:Uncharacterized protein n=1 Tax=Byssothecium circinans TaxID=147558 RepID=A0A6A5U5W7_9PLEO|nr:hypothetical protein CC80DRAFT_259118 [Byssothecium circinans]